MLVVSKGNLELQNRIPVVLAWPLKYQIWGQDIYKRPFEASRSGRGVESTEMMDIFPGQHVLKD